MLTWSVLESIPKCLHKSPCAYWILKKWSNSIVLLAYGMFFYIIITPISTTSGIWSTGNMRKYQQIDVNIYQCDVEGAKTTLFRKEYFISFLEDRTVHVLMNCFFNMFNVKLLMSHEGGRQKKWLFSQTCIKNNFANSITLDKPNQIRIFTHS